MVYKMPRPHSPMRRSLNSTIPTQSDSHKNGTGRWSMPLQSPIMNDFSSQSQWIGSPCHRNAPLFRKEFQISGFPLHAILRVSGLGYHEVFVNSIRVGHTVLQPNQTHYSQRKLENLLHPYEDAGISRVLYLEHEISSLLHEGENVIGVILGNGWYAQEARMIQGSMSYGAPCLKCEIVITDSNGKQTHIVSDKTWKTKPSWIHFNQIFVGERVDLRDFDQNWCRKDTAQINWDPCILVMGPTGLMCRQDSPSDIRHKELAPTEICALDQGRWRVDFGRNFSGWVRMTVSGHSGQKIRMRYAENILPDGELDYQSTGGELSGGAGWLSDSRGQHHSLRSQR